MKKIYFGAALAAVLVAGGVSSCSDDKKETPKGNLVADIPSDDLASPNPVIEGEYTASMANPQYSFLEEEGAIVMRFDMTGIQDQQTMEWIRLIGTGKADQNIWIEVDGKPKGIVVYNTADDANQQKVPIDLTFLVDNSGSMSEEADAVARDIAAWAAVLQQRGLNIKFACVGYDGAITGAIDFVDADELYQWLNKGYSGTSRTMGFANNMGDKDDLHLEAYRTGGNSANECGMAALRFANDHFSFRRNANRIYVNFTDEPNQPNYNEEFSVEWLMPEKGNWTTEMGTVHTVFSDYSEGTHRRFYNEQNKFMSEYTGGTYITTNPSFSGVTLDNLPISDAMKNSYVIRLTNVADLFDGNPHEVKITVLSTDGSVKVERVFYIIFEK